MSELNLRITTGGFNWLTVISEIVLGMKGGDRDNSDQAHTLNNNTRVRVTTPAVDRAGLPTLKMLGRNEADLAITTPTIMAPLARQGRGPFSTQHEIVSLGVLPHEDWLGFAVRADSEIQSLSEISRRQIPLRLSRRRPHYPPHLSGAGFLFEKVLEQYRLTTNNIEKWGGRVDFGARKNTSQIISGEFDAVFDEALMTPSWRQLSEALDLRFLSVDDHVIEFLSDTYGFHRKELPEGYLPGIRQGISTVSVSGWELIIREDVPTDVAYSVTRALDRRKHQIYRRFQKRATADEYTESPLTAPIDMTRTWRRTEIPLHPGAEQYYEENGYK